MAIAQKWGSRPHISMIFPCFLQIIPFWVVRLRILSLQVHQLNFSLVIQRWWYEAMKPRTPPKKRQKNDVGTPTKYLKIRDTMTLWRSRSFPFVVWLLWINIYIYIYYIYNLCRGDFLYVGVWQKTWSFWTFFLFHTQEFSRMDMVFRSWWRNQTNIEDVKTKALFE